MRTLRSVLPLVGLATIPLIAQTIPAAPSVVSVDGTRLVVRKRNPDSTLASPAPYLVRGVIWSPASDNSAAGPDALRAAFGSAASRDLPRIRGLNANTVRLTIDPGADSQGLAVLDEVYRQGLMAAVTVDGGNNDMARAAVVVNILKQHPAVLLWIVGDQWNRNLYHGAASSVADAAQRTESAARLIKSLDPNHPVASSYGEIDIDQADLRLADTQNYVNNIAPAVDLWAVDTAGDTFGNLFEQWRSVTSKPLMAGSFGGRGRSAQAGTASGASALSQWSDLLRNSSVQNSCGAVAGGFAASWTDDSAAISPDQTGVTAIDAGAVLTTDSVSAALKTAFSDTFVPEAEASFTVSSIGSAGSRLPNQAVARVYRSGVLLRPARGVAGAQGFTATVYDPQSGSFEGPLSFDTVSTRTTGTAANELASLVTGARAGSVIMLGVSGDAGLNEAGTCTLSGSAWNQSLISALESIGSTRISSVCAGGGWSMIAVKGSGVIAENVAASGEAVSKASVRLPAVPTSCSQPGDASSQNRSVTGKTAPTPVSVVPNSGTGDRQAFNLTYNFTTPIGWVEMLMATSPTGGGLSYCFIHYDVAGNSFWLYGEAAYFIGPVTPGQLSNALQNEFCALSTRDSTAVVSGNTLTLHLALTFKQAGARNTYLRGFSTQGEDTGWIQSGTWTAVATPLATMTVTPNSGSVSASPPANGQQTFTAKYPEQPGFEGATFGWMQFLIAAASNGGAHFCFIHYDRGGNAFWMYDPSLQFFVGPVTPGQPTGGLNSEACFLDTQNATAQMVGSDFVLTLPFTLKETLSLAPQPKKIFQRRLDQLYRDTSWVQTGTFTITP